jgi:hypothetical protein
MESIHWRARTRHAFGTVALATEDPDTARAHLERALETIEGLGAIPDALETPSELVEIAEKHGDLQTAVVWCDRALELSEGHPDQAGEDR